MFSGACQVSTSVGVDARSDGSGVVRATVTLDADAARQAGDLASRLRVDDLRAAGWRIDGPTPTKDGGQEVRASKGFATPMEASVVVEQLAGDDGPFKSFRLRRSRSFLKTRTSFSGVVDLSRGLGSFSDDELRARLGDPAGLGFDPAEMEGRLGRALAKVFPVRVVVRLPGSVESNALTEASNGAQWSPAFGERVMLRASAERWNTGTIAAGVVAVLGALALLTVIAAAAICRLSRPSQT